MASSRLEKIGTIYSRVQGLIESKAMKPQDIPIWYEIYEKFPPKEEPTFARPAPNIPLKSIFYEEDKIRAEFHKRNKNVGTVNLSNADSKSLTQRFIETYKKLQGSGTVSQEEVYANALEALQRDRNVRQQIQSGEMSKESVSLVSSFKDATAEQQQQKKPSVDVSSLFKD